MDITDLPVEASIAALRLALAGPTHAVLRAEPGAGKTTIVPLRLLNEPWLSGQRIVVLEPRRLAARAAARRMADLLGERVGETVGFRTRDETRVGAGTRVEVVTEGILTRILQRDPSVDGVGLVVFDEIHERNLQSDLALALLLDARDGLRPDLRVLAMSATLDTVRVATLLGGSGGPAPVIDSPGRTYPIDVRWRPIAPRQRPAEAVAGVVGEALGSETGDVLVFLPGAAEIRRVAALLSADRRPRDVDVRPLFGALSPAEQDAALAPSPTGRRRVVLATDIAETSLTVAGVRVVIDSGLVRTPRHDPRSGLSRLTTIANSRASADQRAGRAGRTEPGAAYRLWSPAEHAARRPFAEPEIAVVDLAGFALELALWGAGPETLSFLDPPPSAQFAEARSLLVELGALDDAGRVTSAGRAMAALPVHPRLGRMVLGAVEADRGRTGCALAALLEERDVLRGRRHELPVDVAERISILDRPGGTSGVDRRDLDLPVSADPNALRLVRRRAKELARRVDSDDRRVDPSACGTLLALAYPDRVAQAAGGGRFRMRHGTSATLPEGDSLSGERFLVVAELDRSERDHSNAIRLAAGLDVADLETAFGDAIETVTTLGWDRARNDVRVRTERRVGVLVLSASDGPAQPGDATRTALLDHVRDNGLGVLRWSPKARALQDRAGFVRGAFAADWPDLSDAALLAGVDDWLGPALMGASGRADLEAIDVTRALRNLLGHHRLADLDRLVPTHVTLAGGRRVVIDYDGDQPSIATRAQDLYGTTVHPTVAGGRVPVVVSLLSPAGRPIQVTADLPGFWAGSWSEVRKEMAGRYPKHRWPIDPTTSPKA